MKIIIIILNFQCTKSVFMLRAVAVYRIFAKGGELGVCQKEAVRISRAAAGGWVYLEIQGGGENNSRGANAPPRLPLNTPLHANRHTAHSPQKLDSYYLT